MKKALSLLTVVILASPGLSADDFVFHTGIEYSNPQDQHLKLNLAVPKNIKDKAPAVLCIHGGGFRAGRRERWDKLCKQLASRGYVAATVTYRLAPKFKFPAAIYDVKAAVRWLRANADKYKIDRRRIGVVGDSAGGHLAQFLGVTGDIRGFAGKGPHKYRSSKVQCVINYYGPSDFTKSYGKSVDAAEVLPLWFGGDLKTHLKAHIVASPLNWVTPAAAPTLLLHGSKDPYVAIEQAEWIHERLKKCSVPVKLLRLEGAGHGFRGKHAEQAEKAMFAFLKKYLKK